MRARREAWRRADRHAYNFVVGYGERRKDVSQLTYLMLFLMCIVSSCAAGGLFLSMTSLVRGSRKAL